LTLPQLDKLDKIGEDGVKKGNDRKGNSGGDRKGAASLILREPLQKIEN
jgi:hypothetical protein